MEDLKNGINIDNKIIPQISSYNVNNYTNRENKIIQFKNIYEELFNSIFSDYENVKIEFMSSHLFYKNPPIYHKDTFYIKIFLFYE
jgi:hypothetical protein